ncbi:hypothetical protein CLAFUW4_01925 [Fulvia fulva]|uniref:Uncharacterized protein n=1 Tax=Passalora fulva TaxID=5499 RepID=A0A9Q8L605_PASFU|nr:uncharacterized protein CLAFUR5_01919 [Fulvia fulva]KAK4636250.1 hypothetical protein CLAFUR4_01920 [Fulvia fulva]KAK4637748.1 hypothetical protein CLAFUR0_01922 [Fulvia fulva]UJO11442.1 hypothetical protein CLAFUR5_01919 [Fulvia fulva]WPV08381.1 hypothetical protein CLAFUW4_01925 [Fulvia fulva]WPV25340.1 hypothetical protein CLAFUW7_01924 [Fulvia fulva]
MLPPIQPEILSANPKFDALYRDLCTNKLEHDGTTRLDAKAQKEHDAMVDELRKARVANAKQNLVRAYLRTVSFRGDDLPDELQELVSIIAATLQARLAKEDAHLLRDDVDKFKDNIALIALVVSHAAAEDITALARIQSPEQALDWRDMPTRIRDRQTSIAKADAEIATTRLKLVHEASDLHHLYRKVMETSIRLLEQTIHGSVARSTKAKADYLATVAEGMSRKLQLQHSQLMNQVGSSELQDVLRSKSDDLGGESMTLRRRTRELEEYLEEYRKAQAVEGLAEEYAAILRETDQVQADVERLHSAREKRN